MISRRWAKIALRWSFITSSNFRRFLRMSKLRASTLPWAFSRALFTQGWTMASPSFMPRRPSIEFEPLGAEDPHQVVLEAEVEVGAPRVALAAGAAAELVVDAAAFVALGRQHVEPSRRQHARLGVGDLGLDLAADRRGVDVLARLLGGLQGLDHPHLDVAAELDVGAPAGHVGGDGHRAGDAGLGDDSGLLLVVAGVQHVVRDFGRLQHLRELLGLLDRGGADEDRLAGFVGAPDFLDDRLVLLAGGAEDLVVVVLADHRHVGRHLDDAELVDLEELVGLGGGGAGHAAQLLVEAEVVLEGHGREGHVLGADRDALLGLDRLVQTLAEPPSGHHPAGELVDQHDLAVADDVVLVLVEEHMRPERLVDVVDDVGALGVVELLVRS